jgi:hypothetical protein
VTSSPTQRQGDKSGFNLVVFHVNLFCRFSPLRNAIVIDTFHHLSVSSDFSPLTNVLMTISEQDVNIIGNVQKAFSNFVKTGQASALLIGLIVGYMFRGFTSY